MSKRVGAVSLIIYILLFLGSAILNLWVYNLFGDIAEIDSGAAGIFVIIAAIVLAFGMTGVIISGALMICKIIHLATGWLFFGALCSIGDLIILVPLYANVFQLIIQGHVAELASASLILLICATFTVSFVSNLISLKR